MEREFSLIETSWAQLGEVALSALLAYVAIVVVTRVSGARTTAQLNAFDWIVNVMVGSLAASAILLEDVSLLSALVAITVIVALQFALSALSQTFAPFEKAVKDEPTLLTHNGQLLEAAMRETRVSKDEIYTALRAEGMTDLADANWVILETNGTLSVIPRDANLNADQEAALEDVDAPQFETATDREARSEQGSGRDA